MSAHSKTRYHDSDPLVQLDAGMTWPFGTHTTQFYIVTLLHERGSFTLLDELDKFVPLSSKRFSNVRSVLHDMGVGSLKARLRGRAGEVVHVTALKPSNGSFTVVTSDHHWSQRLCGACLPWPDA